MKHCPRSHIYRDILLAAIYSNKQNKIKTVFMNVSLKVGYSICQHSTRTSDLYNRYFTKTSFPSIGLEQWD